MTPEQKKKLAKAKKPEAFEIKFGNKDLEEIYKRFDVVQEDIVKILEDNSFTKVVDKNGKLLVEFNNSLVKLLSMLEKGIQTKNGDDTQKLQDAIVEAIQGIDIPKSVKVTNLKSTPDWLASESTLKSLIESTDKIADQVKALADQKPNQRPDEFLPFRRVFKEGNILKFDDSHWGGTSGGAGGGMYVNDLPVSANNPVPVDITDANVTLATGDIEIGAVELKNGTDDTRATVTAGNALKVDGSAVAQPITDNSGSITVDAPVGTPAFVRLSDGSSAIATLPMSLASVPSHPVTNAGTFAVQSDTELPAAVVLGDSVSNPTTPMVGASGMFWNGSNWQRWGGALDSDNQGLGTSPQLFAKGLGLNGSGNYDRLKSGAQSNVAAATGYPVSLGVAKYNATPPTITDTRYNDLQADVNANLRVTLATALKETIDAVAAASYGHSFISIAADTIVKSGSGVVHTVTFTCNDAAPTAGSFILYDNTAESGTQILNHTFTTTPFAPCTVILDAAFTTGLYAGFTTTADVNVSISYR